MTAAVVLAVAGWIVAALTIGLGVGLHRRVSTLEHRLDDPQRYDEDVAARAYARRHGVGIEVARLTLDRPRPVQPRPATAHGRAPLVRPLEGP